MKLTRLLLSIAVVAMLFGVTASAQDKKEAPKEEKTTQEAKAPERKHTKKAMKAKMVHAKKKEMKEEKKETAPTK